ncbi:hypothetical protein L2E82_00802 [Cichorium intybus]|uniref:Uncharacterized protein n=1 Tax=Cichorium intybus TaxID=13427 RepID=A0ACB9GX35_CICIN|nr:hypothetical protein L2E82_00802 [Cichorium intybus]
MMKKMQTLVADMTANHEMILKMQVMLKEQEVRLKNEVRRMISEKSSIGVVRASKENPSKRYEDKECKLLMDRFLQKEEDICQREVVVVLVEGSSQESLCMFEN